MGASRNALLAAFALSLSACAIDQNTVNQIKAIASASGNTATPPPPSQLGVSEQVEGLKQALSQGAESAVTSLSKNNGFLGNTKVRIPLPPHLQEADATLRKYGMGGYSADLVTAMNRAAEAAVPEAKALLLNAVMNMTVTDVKNILAGKEDAATQYFRSSTEAALTAKFKPVVAQSMQKVALAQTYNRFASAGVKLGLVKQSDATLDSYITNKALDGLFLLIAEQEKEIRANPLQATGDLARKVFSALLKR